MTREEAIEFFGREIMEPTLEHLFSRATVQSRDPHCKVGATYLWLAHGPSEWNPKGDWVYQRTKLVGWHRITCVYRRSGINFLKIENDPAPSYETAAPDGCEAVNKLIPEVVKLKVFHKNPELDFTWKTYNGLVTIEA